MPMVIKSEYPKTHPYQTKDGSEIRELIHPDLFGELKEKISLSLAEASVGAGLETALHRHLRSQEIYYIQSGEGMMTWGDEVFPVRQGDAVLIPAGTPHKVRNTGKLVLKILCCCAPPYRHDDTELLAGS